MTTSITYAACPICGDPVLPGQEAFRCDEEGPIHQACRDDPAPHRADRDALKLEWREDMPGLIEVPIDGAASLRVWPRTNHLTFQRPWDDEPTVMTWDDLNALVAALAPDRAAGEEGEG